MTDERWIIAGLGNPGPEYAGNRHNAGQMVLALLAERVGARFKAHRTRNDIAEGRLSGQPVTLARPHSYMNLSGGPVSALLSFYKLSPERLVVIHDELDVTFGAVRLKLGGGDNGHNGLRSITSSLGSRDYYRARFGIGRPPGRMDAGRVRPEGLLGRGAQGTPVRARPLRRRRRGPDHQGPDRSPERVPHRPGLAMARRGPRSARAGAIAARPPAGRKIAGAGVVTASREL